MPVKAGHGAVERLSRPTGQRCRLGAALKQLYALEQRATCEETREESGKLFGCLPGSCLCGAEVFHVYAVFCCGFHHIELFAALGKGSGKVYGLIDRIDRAVGNPFAHVQKVIKEALVFLWLLGCALWGVWGCWGGFPLWSRLLFGCDLGRGFPLAVNIQVYVLGHSLGYALK